MTTGDRTETQLDCAPHEQETGGTSTGARPMVGRHSRGHNRREPVGSVVVGPGPDRALPSASGDGEPCPADPWHDGSPADCSGALSLHAGDPRRAALALSR